MFQTFVLAGFECTVTRNMHREPINQISATRHDRRLDEDYMLLRQVGIQAAREGVPWSDVQGRGGYNWTALDRIIEASDRHDIQVIYDLCHFGYPDHLDIFSESFIDAFAEYCYSAVKRINARSSRPCFITPINEPSYFSWAAGEAARFAPYTNGRASELKVQLVKAILAAANAVWSTWPDVQIVNVDPICRAIAPKDNPALQSTAEEFNLGAVLESWDMLNGRLYPELGGTRRHLGIVGVSYYWTNQWELGAPEVPVRDDDERRWPLHRLIQFVWDRYGGDILIAETAHIEGMRGPWMRELVQQASVILEQGIPLKGVCLYPILGMPAWHSQNTWLKMGLWDVATGDQSYGRVVYIPMLEALPELQRLDCHPGLGRGSKGK